MGHGGCKGCRWTGVDASSEQPVKDQAGLPGLLAPPPNKSTSRLDEVRDYQPDFINGMIKVVWPIINDFSKEIMHDVVEPAVRRALGELGADETTFSLDHGNYTIGDKAFEFGKMRISTTTQNTTDEEMPKLRVVIVRTSIDWKSEMKVSANLLGTKLGIMNLGVVGDLMIELVGEMPKPPLFQGVRVSFVNPPEISLTAEMENQFMSKVANFKQVKTTMVGVVEDQLAKKLVSPNRTGVRLDRRADIFRTLFPRACGILKLTICRGEGLVAKDDNFLARATSDPFIKVTCGSMNFKTKTVMRTTDPVFDHVMYVPIHQPEEQRFNFVLTDKDTCSQDDFLGELNLGVEDLIRQGLEETCYDIKDDKGTVGASGKLWLKAEWRKLVFQDTEGAKPNSGLSHLFVGVYDARELPKLPKGTKFWVEVQCTERLGMMGSPVEKPRATPKLALQESGKSQAEHDFAADLRKERKALCKKYKMSDADVELLLGIEAPPEAAHLDADLHWNRPLEFFLGNYTDAKATVALKYLTPAMSTSHTTTVGKFVGTLAQKVHEVVEGGEVLMSESIPVVSLIRQKNSNQHIVLRKPDAATSLHIRLQLRAVGDPTTTI